MTRLSFIVAMLLPLCLRCAQNVVESRDDSTGRNVLTFSTLTPVSDTFRLQAAAAMQTVPKHVQQLIETAGWRIQLADFVVDAQPNLINDQPRGWPNDTTWQNTDAIHFPVERLLVMAEKRRNSRGQVVASARIGGVLRHELGHAFDMASGGELPFRSACSEFQFAYSEDVARLIPETRKELAYYLQDLNAGRQEAFAEAFGIILGGGSDVTREHQFRDAFPRVLAFVRTDLELKIE